MYKRRNERILRAIYIECEEYESMRECREWVLLREWEMNDIENG